MNELEIAKMIEQYDAKEIAKIIGSPQDPAKDMPYFVDMIAQFDEAAPADQVYTYEAAAGTYSVYTVTSNGAITQTEVTPTSPSLMSFISIQSPRYVVKLIQLTSAKEAVLAKYKRYMQRAMDMKECHYVRTLLDTAATAQSNLFTLGSGEETLTYPKVVDMVEAIEDYGTTLKLIAGAQPSKDLRKIEYDANKYQSVKQAMADLGVEVVPVKLKAAARTFGLDDDNSGGLISTDVVAANTAYLVATDTFVGAPILFVRKRVGDVEDFNALAGTPAEKAHRYTFIDPTPSITLAGSVEVLGVNTISFGEIAIACICPQAIARFTRS